MTRTSSPSAPARVGEGVSTRSPAEPAEAAPAFRYDFFFSHNSRDKGTIEQIAEALIDGHNINCWVDVWSIPAAADWQKEIDTALDGCTGALVALGSAGFGPVHAAESISILERAAKDTTFIAVPVVLSCNGQTVGDIVADARVHSAPMPELDQLLAWFGARDCVVWPVGDDAARRMALQKIAKVLDEQDAPPHPFGPDDLTPIRVRRDARVWNEHSRDRSFLYQGRKLEQATTLRAHARGQFDALAEEFLDLSAAEDQRRRNARFRNLTILLVLLVLVLIGVGALAWTTRNALRRAEQSLWTAAGRNAALLAGVEDDKGALAEGIRAVVPGLASDRVPFEALQGVWTAVAAARRSFTLPFACATPARPSLSDHGTSAFLLTREGVPMSVDLATHEARKLELGNGMTGRSVGMSADGSRLWIGSTGGALVRAETNDLVPLTVATPCNGQVTAIADAGAELFVGCSDGGLIAYAVGGEVEELRRVSPISEAVVALDYNTRYLLAVGITTSASVDRGDHRVSALPFMLSGAINPHEQVVGVDIMRGISRVELRDGRPVPLGSIETPGAQYEAVAFGGNGEWIVAGDAGGRLAVFVARGGQVSTTIDTPHDFHMASVVVSRDARRALTTDMTGQCRLWRTDGDSARVILGIPNGDPLRPPFVSAATMPSRRIPEEPSSIVDALSDEGTTISLHRDGKVRRWTDGVPSVAWQASDRDDIERGCLDPRAAGVIVNGKLEVRGSGGPIDGGWSTATIVECSIEGGTLATLDLDGAARTYDISSGDVVERQLLRRPTRLSHEAAARVAPATGVESGATVWRLPGSSRHLATMGNGELRLQQDESWIDLPHRIVQPALALATSSDGKLLAVGNDLGEIWIYAVAEGRLVLTLVGPGGPVTSLRWATTGDLVVGSRDGAVRIYSGSAATVALEACRLLGATAPDDVAELCAEIE